MGHAACRHAAASYTAVFTASELRSIGQTDTQLRDLSYAANEMIVSGSILTKLKTVGYTALNLRNAGASLTNTYNTNKSMCEFQAAGFTNTELSGFGYTYVNRICRHFKECFFI